MSTIEAYDVKARKKVPVKDPEPYQMKNGKWAIKGTSCETGITVYKIVGANEPKISAHSMNPLRRIFHIN